MISIKTPREIELMRVAGEIVGDAHKYLIPYLKPGITTKEIDSLARDYILSRDATPSCYHYNGYPANICISINDEVVHGIASDRKLLDGDIVTLDICVCYRGYHGDSAWTYPVGKISEENARAGGGALCGIRCRGGKIPASYSAPLSGPATPGERCGEVLSEAVPVLEDRRGPSLGDDRILPGHAFRRFRGTHGSLAQCAPALRRIRCHIARDRRCHSRFDTERGSRRSAGI